MSLLGMIALAKVCLVVLLRSHIRNKFNIGKDRGTMGNLEDVACVACCYSCAMCQMLSTMRKFEKEGVLYSVEPIAHA